MEWVLGFMFASGLFGWLGLPVYLVLGTVCYIYYQVINFLGLIYYMQVQWFGVPVEYTLEEDLEVYTLGNYIDYPNRKLWIFTLVAAFGTMASLWPFTNLITIPILGLAAIYNEAF